MTKCLRLISLPAEKVENKVILPVAIGGTIAHLLAGAFILDSLVKKGEDGANSLEEEAAQRLQDSVAQVVQEGSFALSLVRFPRFAPVALGQGDKGTIPGV